MKNTMLNQYDVLQHGKLFESVDSDNVNNNRVIICPECGCDSCKELVKESDDILIRDNIVGNLIFKTYDRNRYECSECKCVFSERVDERSHYSRFIKLIVYLTTLLISIAIFVAVIWSYSGYGYFSNLDLLFVLISVILFYISMVGFVLLHCEI